MCYSVLEGMTITNSLYLVLYQVSFQVVMAGTVQVVALYAVQPYNLVDSSISEERASGSVGLTFRLVNRHIKKMLI